MQQPPTPNPGVEAPVPIQPTLPTSEPTYRHQIRITFPDLAKLAQAGRYSELAQACENLEAAVSAQTTLSSILGLANNGDYGAIRSQMTLMLAVYS